MIGTIILLIGGALLVEFWPQIVDFFSSKIIPWVRNHVSDKYADVIGRIVSFADGKIVLIRRTLKEAWQKFKSFILGMRSTYKRRGANKVEVKTEMFTPSSNGNVNNTIITEQVEWDELPESVRSEMLRQNKQEASLDVREAVVEKVKQEARQRDLLEVLEMEH